MVPAPPAWSVLCLGTCVLYPREVGPFIADLPSRLLLTNEILCKGLLVSLLVISPTEV